MEVEEQRKQVFVKLTMDIKDAMIKISKAQSKHFVTNLSPELIAVCIVGIYERIACYYLLWQDRSADVLQMAQESASFMLGGVNNLFVPDTLMSGKRKKTPEDRRYRQDGQTISMPSGKVLNSTLAQDTTYLWTALGIHRKHIYCVD
ncbi:MAG: hypothetical protein MZV70_73830 [Desulfobacterales bacterium]|nr:hypothetical protein [Desulfobacterales bacterium]